MLGMAAHRVHLHPAHAAFLIVDVQNDYCHPDGAIGSRQASMAHVDQAVAVIGRLAGQARACGVPVIFIRTTHSPATSSEVWAHRTQRHAGKPDIVQEGTWGAEFYKLAPQVGDDIVEKHRYSAFSNTKLNDVLRRRGRKSLVIAGVATNVCVESTAREGFGLEYHITLVRDGCAAYRQDLADAAFANIELSFGRVLDAREIAQAWDGMRGISGRQDGGETTDRCGGEG